jgi:protein arginine phosphatase
MAEALLARLLEQAGMPAEVRSAGTLPWTGGPAHPDAVATAAKAGLDLGRHAAQPLSEELVRWADLVLGMERAHVLQVREIDSTADAHLITEFDPRGRRRDGIDDPIGMGPEVYERVFDEIRQALTGLVAKLTREATSDAV